MNDSEVRLIGLFFFFALLDDAKAIEAASQATDLYQLKIKRKPDPNTNILIIQSTQAIWEKVKGRFQRGRPQYSADAGWILPETLDMGPWKEFQKSAPEDELLAVIWRLLLQIPEEDVSQALGISSGTLRYRLGRALRKLGGFSQATPRRIDLVRS
ncbi:MAG: hypothetical protein BroJett040_19240 [Oligoflexia bacterium]|nr:MAG: hypothetical protein BroJett040_19240 [Oligoflexia bacterium]